MHYAHIRKRFFLKFVNFINFLLTHKGKCDIIKMQRGRDPTDQGLTKEVRPMQNLDEPFHFSACRYENDGMARISSIAAGNLQKLNINPISDVMI